MNKRFAALLALALAGCASNPPLQRPAQLGLPLASLKIEVRLTQHEIMIPTGHSTAGSAGGMQAAASPSVAAGGFAAGAAAGLIGALIDAAIDAHRNGVAEEAVKPMREHMAASHPDELVLGSFSALDRAHLAQQITLEVIGRSEQDDLDHKLLAPEANVLVLVPSYAVSYDGSTFTYRLDARLVYRVQSGNGPVTSVPRYRQVFDYVVRQERAPAKWADMTTEQWKDLMTEAATETIAMLNYDVVVPMKGTAPQDDASIPAHLERKSGERKWTRSPSGLVSVPLDDAKAAAR